MEEKANEGPQRNAGYQVGGGAIYDVASTKFAGDQIIFPGLNDGVGAKV